MMAATTALELEAEMIRHHNNFCPIAKWSSGDKYYDGRTNDKFDLVSGENFTIGFTLGPIVS